MQKQDLLSNQKEVEDPDQHWMLDEWIKYVAAEESRIIDPPSLGVYWSVVLQAAKEQKLSAVSSQLTDVTEHWDAFLKKLALRLRAKMGADVQRRTSRADVKNPDGRIKRMYTEALHTGILTGALQVRGAIGELGLTLMAEATRNSTQNSRSTFESRGRFTERRSTASCWRRVTFSRASSRRALKAETRARTNEEIMPAWCRQTGD